MQVFNLYKYVHVLKKFLLFSRLQWVSDWTMLGSDLVQINVELWKCWTKPAGFHKGLKAAFALSAKATGFN